MHRSELRNVLRWSWRGKSIARSRMNAAMTGLDLRGRVLDLGGGSDPSYRPLLDHSVDKWVVTDISAEKRPSVVCDLEVGLPFAGGVFDAITAFNLLEHVYGYQQLADETYRVLKPGGVLHVMVPFLVQVHADPHDHFRYTASTLYRLCRHAGYEHVEVAPLGGVFQSLVNIVSFGLRPRPLRFAAVGLALGLDSVLERLRGRFFEEKWVLMYWVRAEKGRANGSPAELDNEQP